MAELTTPDLVLAGHPNYGLAEITVETVIRAGLSVKFNPEEGERGHVMICGGLPPSKSRELSRASRVLIPPNIEGDATDA